MRAAKTLPSRAYKKLRAATVDENTRRLLIVSGPPQHTNLVNFFSFRRAFSHACVYRCAHGNEQRMRGKRSERLFGPAAGCERGHLELSSSSSIVLTMDVADAFIASRVWLMQSLPVSRRGITMMRDVGLLVPRAEGFSLCRANAARLKLIVERCNGWRWKANSFFLVTLCLKN